MSKSECVQVLRTIDKYDKIGEEGIEVLLQKPLEEFGANLDPIRAELITRFVAVKGVNNSDTLDKMSKSLEHCGKVMARVNLMAALDSIVDCGEKTAWDRLLETRRNDDETWTDGGRPANIGWALDDIIEAMIAARNQ
jgi:hypothetical protein